MKITIATCQFPASSDDYRYPELYREYKRRGVQLMFHSYHAGGIDSRRFAEMQNAVGRENGAFNSRTTIPGITMPAAMYVAAANNYMWTSCPNSSRKESCWPAFFVRPDGIYYRAVKVQYGRSPVIDR